MTITRYKVGAYETDGVEGDIATEVPLDADNVYFNDPAYTADNTKDAITETSTKGGQARYSIILGYGSNSSNGRWLEVFAGNASNTSPYVVSEPSELTSLSISNKSNADGATFTVYKNGTSIATVAIGDNTTDLDYGYITLDPVIALSPGDRLSMRQTSTPSTQEPVGALKIKVNF